MVLCYALMFHGRERPLADDDRAHVGFAESAEISDGAEQDAEAADVLDRVVVHK